MIKRRLKHTASFFALWFPVLASCCVGLLWLPLLFAVVRFWSVILALFGPEENNCGICCECGVVLWYVYTVDIMQTITRAIQYNDMVLSVMIHELYSP